LRWFVLFFFIFLGCGFCKKLKPDFSEAATELKSSGVLAAVDVDVSTNFNLRRVYNITGFPTLIYFKNGEMQFQYGGEMNKKGLVEWMKNPHPPVEKEPEPSWAEESDVEVTFLDTNNFDEFIATHNSVLVKFYATC
jgi:thiol-disulfide isomerase/thioredoxin